ncbi:hypothetical protein AWB80_08478 [Caballeronia pedi]|uniref:Uncharacterized protein n=1 Tax=Caballeronia pedi TaxID=1777141 RepID=A0A158E7X9_9BURK|nr:hypothetical protein AWB80_08478 [Caballeronia pedi]
MRRGRAEPRRAAPRAQCRACVRSRRASARYESRRHDRHRPHALGDARRARHRQRAPDLLARYRGARAQRHHRELRVAARDAQGQGLRVRLADGYRSHRASDSQHVSRRPVPDRTRCRQATAWRVCDRRDAQGSAAYGRRRAPGFAARRRRGRGRELPRLGRARARRQHRPLRLPRRRRRGGDPARRREDRRSRRSACRARSARGDGVWRRGGTRPVSPLHAEGNLRAAARDHRHDPASRRVQPEPVWRRRARRVRGRRQPADSCVRHELLLGSHGEVLARIDREDSDAGRDRERVSLSRVGAESEGAGRHDLAIGRNRRHARRVEARAVARPQAHARGVQRRDQRDGASDRVRIPDACGHGDRRGIDEGVHDAARRFVRAGRDAREDARSREREAGSRVLHATAALAGGVEQRACAGAADHRVVGGIRAQGECAVPRTRPALSDRARRRAEAEGNFVHPRGSVSGG